MHSYILKEYIINYKKNILKYIKFFAYQIYAYEFIELNINNDDLYIIIKLAYKLLIKLINTNCRIVFNKYDAELYLKKHSIVCLIISQKFHINNIKFNSQKLEELSGFDYDNIIFTERKVLISIDYKILEDYLYIINNNSIRIYSSESSESSEYEVSDNEINELGNIINVNNIDFNNNQENSISHSM